MEHLDKLIPLAVLGAVAGLLAFLLRRAMREDSTPLSTVKPPKVEQAAAPPSAIEAAEAPRAKRAPKPVPADVPAAPPAPTPIDTVLGLLKTKDALPAAFLLREILAPPLAKR
jgi:nucleoid-associated protein YgaU